MNSGMWQIHLSDLQKALVMAAFMGAALPVAAAVQTPGFDIFTTNWLAIGNLALNGAVIGFSTYLLKNVLSDQTGAFLGKFGGVKTPQN